jgi:hypothetical protein
MNVNHARSMRFAGRRRRLEYISWDERRTQLRRPRGSTARCRALPAATRRRALGRWRRLTALCWHRGRACSYPWCTTDALPRPLCRCESIILLGDDAWLLTGLSNVVAYPCRHSRQKIGIMSATQGFFGHLEPTTSVSPAKVFGRAAAAGNSQVGSGNCGKCGNGCCGAPHG